MEAERSAGGRRVTGVSVAVALILILILIIAIAVFLDNNRLIITRYHIESEKITGNVKILQISDFHSCDRLCGKLLNAIKEERPDVIVITGDFIRGDEMSFPMQQKILDSIPADTRVYFVSGNHEAAPIRKYSFYEMLQHHHVKILSEDTGRYMQDNIFIYGINDPAEKACGYEEELAEMKNRIEKLQTNEEHFNILLSHRPEAFYYCKGKNLDLVLSGHTHGGQIRLPFIGGLFAPGQGWFPKYDAGKFEECGSTLIISRGIGDSSFPIRVNDTPQVVVVNLSGSE